MSGVSVPVQREYWGGGWGENSFTQDQKPIRGADKVGKGVSWSGRVKAAGGGYPSSCEKTIGEKIVDPGLTHRKGEKNRQPGW